MQQEQGSKHEPPHATISLDGCTLSAVQIQLRQLFASSVCFFLVSWRGLPPAAMLLKRHFGMPLARFPFSELRSEGVLSDLLPHERPQARARARRIHIRVPQQACITSFRGQNASGARVKIVRTLV